MRRLVPILLAVLLTIGLVSPAAAGGKPESFPNEPITQFFDQCGFDVGLQDTHASGRFFIFPTDAAGDTRLVSAGGFKSTLTNLEDPSISIDITFHGRGEFNVLADGNIWLRASGQAVWWFDDAADAAMFGLEPGMYLITGRVEVLLDANQVALAPARMHARVRDLCAELASPA